MNDLLTFLDGSPSRYHAVEQLRRALEAEGYVRLSESRRWEPAPGGKYYAVRRVHVAGVGTV